MRIVGRFAPSPTGPLHVGNLRTALLAYLCAKSGDGRFIVRFEDLDVVTATREHAVQQLADLESLGIFSDVEPVFQSDRFDLYNAAIGQLTERSLTYECFCTRKEVREAAAAPHGEMLYYPGTCRDLTEAERVAKRAERAPALRLRGEGLVHEFVDRIAGRQSGQVDDVVLRRNDGVPSYNVAVVVDDALQGINQVVRGDDLLGITPTQIHLQQLLGYETPQYVHVPLVVGPDGERLAKRHGSVTLADLTKDGHTPAEIKAWLWQSLGQIEGEPFDLARVPRHPYAFAG